MGRVVWVNRPGLCFATVFGGFLDEFIVGELASPRETVHTLADFEESMFMVDEGLELVLLHDVGRDDFDMDSHVFVTVHGSVQVKVFDVDRHEFGIGIGQDAVKEALGCGNVGGVNTDVSWVFDEVVASSEADSFDFGLIWSYFGNDV